MPSFITSSVAEVLETRKGLQKLRISDGSRAYALTDVIGEVSVGDEVVLNTTAVELELGTGGWHVVHWNLARSSFSQRGPGHIMKARYLSEQTDAGSAEEHTTPSEHLQEMPVVACFLLSQAAIAAVAFRNERPDARIAMVITDQAALPVAFSDLLHALRERNVVDTVISAGQAFGGDLEAVNVASALGLAHVMDHDVVFVTEGPGVVGTGSRFGFSGFEMAGVVDLVHKLGGSPYVAIRYSEGDSRERHQGVSHHTMTVLSHCKQATIAVPQGEEMIAWSEHTCVSVDVGDVAQLLNNSGLHVTTMGRTFEQDKGFFHYAAAAGIAAARAARRM